MQHYERNELTSLLKVHPYFSFREMHVTHVWKRPRKAYLPVEEVKSYFAMLNNEKTMKKLEKTFQKLTIYEL